MTRTLPLILALLFWASGISAQSVELPALTGRVVDQAELLDTQAEARLTSMLAAHEQASGEQVVVVTVPDLQGRSIEEFGVELGREWGIGQKEEDTGALLIVARDDRRVRIEVGYGLEGRLTDAQSSVIINRIITPAFREGDFTRGITEGAAAIVQVLGGDPLRTAELPPAMPMGAQQPGGLGILGFFLMLVAIFVIGGGRGGRGGGRGAGRALLLGALLGGMGRGGGGGFGGGGGGFGGGGGGFGGGGASGGW
ncbi:methanol dehydrogenase [Pseudomonas sp. MT-1]|uniref:TPM domain-containing protein n=1 Tax=Stutzerimonas stutzeri TaxID=316 RepID=UPI000535BC2C|nr:TPM domain-containing protein [Stutzerimonas stutzeri]MCQ4284429.1 TPM domain-containing protein [Stutzerimonas stutzeri]BAP81562.1 methanol dehydrogenase [Pseudomonas sp. MT-1]